jgi:hypothetical protein
MGATEDRLKSYSFPGCEAAIEAVVDSTRMPSGLRVDVLMTRYEGWFAGPQDVLCVVVGDSPWTGSVMPRKFLS